MERIKERQRSQHSIRNFKKPTVFRLECKIVALFLYRLTVRYVVLKIRYYYVRFLESGETFRSDIFSSTTKSTKKIPKSINSWKTSEFWEILKEKKQQQTIYFQKKNKSVYRRHNSKTANRTKKNKNDSFHGKSWQKYNELRIIKD